MPKEHIELHFTGGMNNLDTPLQLGLRKRAEAQLIVNGDTSVPGQIRPLRPFQKLNPSSPATSIKSLHVAEGVVFFQDGQGLYYLTSGGVPTLLKAGLSSGKFHFDDVGDWLFIGTGDNKKSVHIPTLTVCDWGCDVPDTAPTVAIGASGNPSGTYSCYYRHKITLPDGTILRTALSPVASITVTSQKISWSNIVSATFEGATTIQVELFRASASMAGPYLVTTLNSGTSTYTDNIDDATLQTQDEYAETGYWPPPSNPNLVKYYEASDRIFCTVGGDAYWSEPGEYHVFAYNATAEEYENVNSVFLGEESVTAIKLVGERLYFGSVKTWIRLQGTNPSNWTWPPTQAVQGPINDDSATVMDSGVPFPCLDGKIRFFDGYNCRPILDEFVFSTIPGQYSHSVFDGRLLYLFYNDPVYPCLRIDFLRFPLAPPRITVGTTYYVCSFFDRSTGQLYVTDSQYIRRGVDTTTPVTMTIRTAEMIPEDLALLGTMSRCVMRINTGGADLTITPRPDDAASSDPVTVNTASLQFADIPMPFGDYFSFSMDMTITTAEEVILSDPIIFRRD